MHSLKVLFLLLLNCTPDLVNSFIKFLQTACSIHNAGLEFIDLDELCAAKMMQLNILHRERILLIDDGRSRQRSNILEVLFLNACRPWHVNSCALNYPFLTIVYHCARWLIPQILTEHHKWLVDLFDQFKRREDLLNFCYCTLHHHK